MLDTTEKLAGLIFGRCAGLLGQTGDDVIPPLEMPTAFLLSPNIHCSRMSACLPLSGGHEEV
jgi:hypothetical protein